MQFIFIDEKIKLSSFLYVFGWLIQHDDNNFTSLIFTFIIFQCLNLM